MRSLVAVLCAVTLQSLVASAQAQTAREADSNGAAEPARAAGGGSQHVGEAPTLQAENGAGRVVPVRRDTAGTPATELIIELLPPPQDEAIAGTPISLLDVVSVSVDPAQQDQTVRAYWNLAIAIANHHCALDLLRRSEALARQSSASGQSQQLAAAATSRAQADVDGTLLAVREAQHALLRRQPAPLPAELPLPSDRPHVGAYRTYFDRFFGATASKRARQLHETLPMHYELIQARAAAVMATRQLADPMASEAEASVREALASHQTLASQYRALLDSVGQYNLRIAEYARLVSPGATNPRQFVAMLVKSEPQRLSADVTDRARPLDDDGLMSVLIDNSKLADGTTPSAVRPATAEQAAEDGDWKSQAPAERRDGFVPRHPDRE